MSEEITAMCTSGIPPGRFLNTSMKLENWRCKPSCEADIDGELSTMNSRSIFLFNDDGVWVSLMTTRSGVGVGGGASERESHATPAVRPAIRVARTNRLLDVMSGPLRNERAKRNAAPAAGRRGTNINSVGSARHPRLPPTDSASARAATRRVRHPGDA